MRRRTARGCAITSMPATSAEPESGFRRVLSTRTMVVLPAPLGPSRPSTVPLGTVRSTPSSAVTLPYVLTSPRAEMAGSMRRGYEDPVTRGRRFALSLRRDRPRGGHRGPFGGPTSTGGSDEERDRRGQQCSAEHVQVDERDRQSGEELHIADEPLPESHAEHDQRGGPRATTDTGPPEQQQDH